MSDKELSENLSFKVSLKTLGGIAALISTAIGYHYYLINQIEEAKAKPKIGTGYYIVDPADPAAKESYPPSRQEYEMKDELARREIMLLKEEIKELKNK
jgi:hypothetical protein